MIKVNGIEIKIEKFPNKESLIKQNQIMIYNGVNDILMKFESNEDLFNLIMIKSHIDNESPICNLKITYMPYSRMDRTEGETVFTLKHVCKIINSLKFNKVFVLEPHSNTTIALLDRVECIDATKDLTLDLIKKLDFNEYKNDYIFYPDEGARKRYGKQIDFENVMYGNKTRDFKTGRIEDLKIEGFKYKGGFRVIIVDDLCSRGGTFMMSANKLRELGATDVYLVVTHCEDTIYDGDILTTDVIDKVFTTDSLLTRFDNDKIKILKSVL